MTDQFTIKDAMTELAARGDSIITVALADRLAQAFGYEDAASVGARVYDAERGIDWDRRAEVYDAGLAVDVYDLALSLAEKEGCEPIEGYRTDYLGAGKRTRALTGHAVCQLRMKHEEGFDVPRCSECGKVEWTLFDAEGNANTGRGNERVGRCWPCTRDAEDRVGA